MFATIDDFWHQNFALLRVVFGAGAPRISEKNSNKKTQIIECSKRFLAGLCLPTQTFTADPLSAGAGWRMLWGAPQAPSLCPWSLCFPPLGCSFCNRAAFPGPYISWVTFPAILLPAQGCRAAVGLSVELRCFQGRGIPSLLLWPQMNAGPGDSS